MDLDSMLPVLIREREMHKREFERCEQMIALLQDRKAETQVAPAEFTTVKPDRYKGERPIDAAISYLAENRGLRVPLSHLAYVLEVGNAVMEKRAHRHNLRIGIPNRRELDFEPKDISKKGVPIVRKGVPDHQVFVWHLGTRPKRKRHDKDRRFSYRTPKPESTAEPSANA